MKWRKKCEAHHSLNKLVLYGKINEQKKWKCKELKWSKKCEAHHSLNKLVLYGKINEWKK